MNDDFPDDRKVIERFSANNLRASLLKEIDKHTIIDQDVEVVFTFTGNFSDFMSQGLGQLQNTISSSVQWDLTKQQIILLPKYTPSELARLTSDLFPKHRFNLDATEYSKALKDFFINKKHGEWTITVENSKTGNSYKPYAAITKTKMVPFPWNYTETEITEMLKTKNFDWNWSNELLKAKREIYNTILNLGEGGSPELQSAIKKTLNIYFSGTGYY